MKKIIFAIFLLSGFHASAQFRMVDVGGQRRITTIAGVYHPSAQTYGSGDSLKLVDYAQLYRAINSIGGGGGSSSAIGSVVTGATAGSILYIGTGGILQQSNSLFFRDSTNNRVGFGTNTPSSRLDITTNSIGTTQDNAYGISLVNTTAAAAGAQQLSPGLRFRGQGWKTNATAGSQTLDFLVDLLPVQGAANPTSTLQFKSSINGAAYTTPMTLTSGGNLTILGSLTASVNVVATQILATSSGVNGFSGGTRFINVPGLSMRVTDSTGGTFGRLIFGANNSSHWAIKHSLNGLYIVRADDLAMGNIIVAPEPYGAGWDEDSAAAAKNDVYDKIESVVASLSGDSKVVPDADYTILATDAVIILPDPAATRTLTIPAASTMQNKEITIFCKATSVGEWVTSGSFVQNGGNLTEDHINSGLGSNQILRLRSCNHGGTWRWYDLNP